MIDHALDKKLYQMADKPPRFYGLPKANMPIRPIISSSVPVDR